MDFNKPDSSLDHIQVSKVKIRWLAGLSAMLMTFCAVMTWGFWHYRAQSHVKQDALLASLQYEKAELVSKVGALEGTIQRIEKFTDKLEGSVGVETGKMKIGVGPVSTSSEDLGEFLSKLDKLPTLSAKSLNQDWRQGKFDQQFYEKLSFKLDELYHYASKLELRVNEVYEAHEDSLSFWASNPSAWPVHGWVTSDFGYRFSPWGGGDVRMHKGIDIAAPYGSEVDAPADGVVTFAGYRGGYGNAVIIDHGYGLNTLYGHNSLLFVSSGDRVRRGQKISAVGSTGSSTGPHLHYEVHVDGVPTNPMNYISQ